jgi:hypothetical protein
MNPQPGANEFLAAFSDDPPGQRQLRPDLPHDNGPQSIMLAHSRVADEAMSRDFAVTAQMLSNERSSYE